MQPDHYPRKLSQNPVRLVVLGVANGKRVQGLRSAAQTLQPYLELVHVDYADALKNPEILLSVLTPYCWLKIESPGEDLHVQNELIRQGWALQNDPSRPLKLPEVFGELTATDDWFYGFSHFLQKIELLIPSNYDVRFLNSVESILLMTDKWRCQHHFQEHHIPTPKILGQIHNYESFEALLQQYPESSQVFIKPRFGSSASGVIAYRHNRRGQQIASSSITFEGDTAFNSKKVKRYSNPKDITRLINIIAPYGAYVEEWIAKPGLKLDKCQLSFDFRVVTIATEPHYQIVRASSHPMTNLHLDSKRLEAQMVNGKCDIPAMQATVKQAARAFSGAAVIGFDVICSASSSWVLEANAFGDLLLYITHQGRTTYGAQLDYILHQQNITSIETSHA